MIDNAWYVGADNPFLLENQEPDIPIDLKENNDSNHWLYKFGFAIGHTTGRVIQWARRFFS